jgi:hypothetical protein
VPSLSGVVPYLREEKTAEENFNEPFFLSVHLGKEFLLFDRVLSKSGQGGFVLVERRLRLKTTLPSMTS